MRGFPVGSALLQIEIPRQDMSRSLHNYALDRTANKEASDEARNAEQDQVR